MLTTPRLEHLKSTAKQFLESSACGHDFLHCLRVAKLADTIAEADFPAANREGNRISARKRSLLFHSNSHTQASGPLSVNRLLRLYGGMTFTIRRRFPVLRTTCVSIRTPIASKQSVPSASPAPSHSAVRVFARCIFPVRS